MKISSLARKLKAFGYALVSNELVKKVQVKAKDYVRQDLMSKLTFYHDLGSARKTGKVGPENLSHL